MSQFESSLTAAIAQLRGHKHTSFSRLTGLGDDVTPVVFEYILDLLCLSLSTNKANFIYDFMTRKDLDTRVTLVMECNPIKK